VDTYITRTSKIIYNLQPAGHMKARGVQRGRATSCKEVPYEVKAAQGVASSAHHGDLR